MTLKILGFLQAIFLLLVEGLFLVFPQGNSGTRCPLGFAFWTKHSEKAPALRFECLADLRCADAVQAVREASPQTLVPSRNAPIFCILQMAVYCSRCFFHMSS